MYTLTTLFADGREPQVDLYEKPSLENLQAAVGGPIEAVPYFSAYGDQPCVAFCNEYGKREGKPLNSIATAHWFICAPRMHGYDVLVGDVLVITADDPAMLGRL